MPSRMAFLVQLEPSRLLGPYPSDLARMQHPLMSHAQVAKLPAHRDDAYLPDFVGSPMDPTTACEGRSPFLVSSVHLVEVYGNSDVRKSMLIGLLDYRARLRAAGLSGFQWLDGSFIGDVEKREGRDPGDIDVVTFYKAAGTQQDLFKHDPSLWQRPAIKQRHQLDAFPISVLQNPFLLLTQACYWHGMWSRSKRDPIPCMKGFVALILDGTTVDDENAKQLLTGRGNQP